MKKSIETKRKINKLIDFFTLRVDSITVLMIIHNSEEREREREWNSGRKEAI